MSSFRLSPTPVSASRPLPADHQDAPAGVTITERRGLALCSVMARKNASGLLAERVRENFGMALPLSPATAGPGAVEFIWAGPHQWLALSERHDANELERLLRTSLGSAASLTDQSEGRTILRISGPRTREALAKGVHIDLHPRVFRPGDVAMTSIAHINVHLWQVDETPTYDVATFRSFEIAFWDWLIAASVEFNARP